MIKSYLLVFCLLLWFSSCKKNIGDITPSDPSVITIPSSPDLHPFAITISDLTTTSVKLQWSEAADYQSDSILYDVSLDGTEIASNLKKTSYTIHGLIPAVTYHLQIRANASENNYIVAATDFTTMDGYIKFNKTYYPDVYVWDVALSPDNGYLMCLSNGRHQLEHSLEIIKTDSLGNELWKKDYPYDGTRVKMLRTKDGYYIMGPAQFVVKIDFNGNELWHTILSALGKHFTSIFEASNGDLLLTGGENGSDTTRLNQASITRLDSHGDLIWHKSYGTSFYGQTNDIINADTQGDFFVVGTKETSGLTSWRYLHGGGSGNSDFWLFKINSDGEVIWEKTYGDKRYDFAAGIRIVNNQLVFGGFNMGIGDIREIQLFRASLDGTLLKTIPVKPEAFYDRLNFIETTSDNGYIIIYDSGLGTGYPVLGVTKYDSADNKQWENTYSPGFPYITYSKTIRQTPDDGYIVPANKSKLYGEGANTWLLKLNPQGSYQ